MRETRSAHDAHRPLLPHEKLTLLFTCPEEPRATQKRRAPLAPSWRAFRPTSTIAVTGNDRSLSLVRIREIGSCAASCGEYFELAAGQIRTYALRSRGGLSRASQCERRVLRFSVTLDSVATNRRKASACAGVNWAAVQLVPSPDALDQTVSSAFNMISMTRSHRGNA